MRPQGASSSIIRIKKKQNDILSFILNENHFGKKGRIVIPNIILPGLDFQEGLFLEWQRGLILFCSDSGNIIFAVLGLKGFKWFPRKNNYNRCSLRVASSSIIRIKKKQNDILSFILNENHFGKKGRIVISGKVYFQNGREDGLVILFCSDGSNIIFDVFGLKGFKWVAL